MNPIEKFFINQKNFDEVVDDEALFDIDFANYDSSNRNNLSKDDRNDNEPNFGNLFDKDGFQAPMPKQEFLSNFESNIPFEKSDEVKNEELNIENDINGFDQIEQLIPELSIIGEVQSKITRLFSNLRQELFTIEESIHAKEVEEAEEYDDLEKILKFTIQKFDELNSFNNY